MDVSGEDRIKKNRTEELLKEKRATVEVMESAEKWYGVTYKEDKKSVMDAISEMKQQGVYPEDLWK